jgi:hypothetical protein
MPMMHAYNYPETLKNSQEFFKLLHRQISSIYTKKEIQAIMKIRLLYRLGIE